MNTNQHITYADQVRAEDPLAWEIEGAKFHATELIARLMQRRKVTKTELAKRLSVTQAAVTGYLSGSRNLTLEKLTEILFVLGFRLDLRSKVLPEVKSAPKTAAKRRRSAAAA